MSKLDEKSARVGEDGKIILTHPITGAEKAFLRTLIATAWGDPLSENPVATLNGGALAAESESGKITVLRACEADLPRLCEQSIAWKDLFAVNKVFADPEPEGHFRALRAVNGLQKYKKKFPYIDIFQRPIYEEEEPLKRWPTYQNKSRLAEVVTAAYPYLKDFYAADSFARHLVVSKEAMADLAFIPHIEKIWVQPLNLRVESPTYRAIISVIWHMKHTSRVGKERGEHDHVRPWRSWQERKR